MVGEPRRHRGRGNLVREKKSATEFWTSAPLSARPAVIVRNLHLEISIQALVVYGFGSDGLPPEADASSSHFSHTHPPTPRHKISVGPWSYGYWGDSGQCLLKSMLFSSTPQMCQLCWNTWNIKKITKLWIAEKAKLRIPISFICMNFTRKDMTQNVFVLCSLISSQISSRSLFSWKWD